jgi:hypothetical protein
MKPMICRRMRPTRSASRTANTIPTISSTSISAAPLVARMSLWMSSAMLRGCSMLAPITVARIVGVKIPMP